MGLKVKFYDVEHGSCSHIITPNGKHFLFDIGSKSDKSICEHLKNEYFWSQGQIDYLIISHPHVDHIADLENLYTYKIAPLVLKRAKAAFPLQITASDSASQIAAKKRANLMNDTYISPVLVDPALSDNNGGVDIQDFWPTVSSDEASDLNNFSNVMVLKYAGFKIVLTGDNPSLKLEEMLAQDSFRQAIADATVLLAPHHGRDSDFSDTFVKAVNPLLTVMSDKPIQHETQACSAQKYYSATRGTIWDGKSRYVFTTRNDGTITFSFEVNGSWSISTSKTEY